MRKNTEDKMRSHVAKQLGTIPGGISEPDDIRLLICYLLVHIGRPLTKEQLDEIIPGSELVNYFAYAEALTALTEGGQLELGGDGFRVSAAGHRACEVLQDSLPLSVRDRVLGRGLQVLHRSDVLSENNFTVEDAEGRLNIVCNMRDRGGEPLMSVSASVGSGELAASLGRRFLADPSLLYNSVFAVLSGDSRTLESIAEKMKK